jgi:hypothetical protein
LGCEPSGGGRISSAPIHRAALISRPRFGERWGRYRSKRWYGDTIFSSYSCTAASVAWETDSITQGGPETRRPPASPRPCSSAVHVGRQAGRMAGWMGLTGVRLSGLVCGWVLRGAVAVVERGGNMSGLAWRYAREAQTGARYGAPRVAVPVDELQSQPRCRSVCICMCVVCQKCRCLSELVSLFGVGRRYEVLLYVGLNIECVFTCRGRA